MSLANIQGKLSRGEMKNIMAGSGSNGCPVDCMSSDCTTSNECVCYGHGDNAFCDQRL